MEQEVLEEGIQGITIRVARETQGGYVDAPKIQAEGQLERAGSTRYRSGTHVLVYPGDRDIRFVLRSETVQLREYEGQRVRINASLVEDYVPDEGDPKLLDVFSITSLQQD